ncbi:MAG: TSUP family transporter [Clostridia bacterium]|nr:TSUP family transporter [Clostridia bacterium]
MRKNNEKKEKKIAVLCGVISGFINGLFGGGGGMIVVPTLTQIFKEKQNVAHATSVLIILPFSLISAILYVVFRQVDYSLYPVSIGVIAGGIIGAFLLKKLPEKIVFFSFVALMGTAGVKLLFF